MLMNCLNVFDYVKLISGNNCFKIIYNERCEMVLKTRVMIVLTKPHKFKKQSPWTPDPEVQNPGGPLLKNLYSILFSKFILSHIMVHVACHDLRSFHNFNLLTYFSFAYKSLYRCALWCFTSMYATLSLLHLKFDKLLMMRVRIASINSYVYYKNIIQTFIVALCLICFVKTITD